MQSAALQDLKALGKNALYALPNLKGEILVDSASRMEEYYNDLEAKASRLEPGDLAGFDNLLSPDIDRIGEENLRKIFDTDDMHGALRKVIEEKRKEQKELLYEANRYRSWAKDVSTTPEINTDDPDWDMARSAGIRKLPRDLAEAVFLNALSLSKGVTLAYDVLNYSKGTSGTIYLSLFPDTLNKVLSPIFRSIQDFGCGRPMPWYAPTKA